MYKRVEAGPLHFPQKPILFPSNRIHTYVKGLENRALEGLQGMESFSLKKAVKSPTRGNLSESLGDWERGTAWGCMLALREGGWSLPGAAQPWFPSPEISAVHTGGARGIVRV